MRDATPSRGLNTLEAVATPCRRVCRLGSDGLCDGCGRTLAEIAAWLALADPHRATILTRVRDWRPRGPDGQPADAVDPASGQDQPRSS